MKITKLGHCCMLVEDTGLRVLTDPGAFTLEQQEAVTDLDLIVITHEHQDHLHVESLKKILAQNPKAKVATNTAVKKILGKEGLEAIVVEDGQSQSFEGFTVEGFGVAHAVIYPELPQVQNTGFLFNGKFYFPGDAFYVPPKPVEILALPVAGPWMKFSEVVDFAREIKPKVAFPVHDGMLNSFGGFLNNMGQALLKPAGIDYRAVELGQPMEF